MKIEYSLEKELDIKKCFFNIYLAIVYLSFSPQLWLIDGVRKGNIDIEP